LQASRQARVVSQNTSIGRWSNLIAGRGGAGLLGVACVVILITSGPVGGLLLNLPSPRRRA